MIIISRLLSQRGWGPGPSGSENRESVIYGFMGGFGPLAFTAVCLRLYTRWRFSKLGYDDLAVTIGFVLYMGLLIATIFAIHYGLGLHIQDVPYDRTGISMQKCGFTSQVLYPTSLGAIKLSVILFLLRTLPPVHFWRKPLYAFATWVVVEETAFTIGLFLQCRPIAFYWDKSVKGGTCFDQPSFYYVDAALNMTTDLCILSLPWLLFRRLNMPKRRKYELMMVCSVGVFTLIASAIRLPYLHELNQSIDPTWQVVDVCIWSIAELGSAITLSSVPAIRPLLSHIFPNIIRSSSAHSSKRQSRKSGTGGGGTGLGGSSLPSKTGGYGAHSKSDSMSGSGSGSGGSFPYVELDEVEDVSRRKESSAGSQEYILGGEDGLGGREEGRNRTGGITKTVDFRVRDEQN